MNITNENFPYLIGMIIIVILIIGSTFILISMIGTNSNIPVSYNLNETDYEKENNELNESNLKSTEECLADLGYNKLIYLYTSTCPACRSMTPVVQELIDEGYDIYMADAYKDSNYAKITNCVSIKNSVPQYICNNDGVATTSIVSKEKLIEIYNNC